MAETSGEPVAAGLAVGIALIAVFSYLSSPLNIIGFKKVSVVNIPEGASIQSNSSYLEPETIKVVIGVNNPVRWVNHDSVPQGLSSDDDYADPLTGIPFDTRARANREGGPFVMPRGSYEFTFREPGEYGYHGEPHPWMQGTVIVSPR